MPGPAERSRPGVRAAAPTSRELAELPDRFSLFGLTRLPAGHLQVLRALAAHRDVHLFLLHPSPALWEKVAGRPRHGAPAIRRADDPTAGLAANRLLASWGRDAREMQLVLAAAGAEATTTDTPSRHAHRAADPARPDPGRHPRRSRRARARRCPASATDGRCSSPTTAAIEIHSCHGRARQVEVIRDAILHVLAEDPTLEPRDVIVMCPDIETFAPLIQATFGAGEATLDGDDGATGRTERPHAIDLRVRLADRSLRQTNPVLGVVVGAARARRAAADRLAGARPRRPRRRCAAAFASTTTTSPGSRTGSRRPGSAGASTRRTARRSSSSGVAQRHLARRASTGCCSG